MQIAEEDLKKGMKFIVGTWQVDYLVNSWSSDLAHIPASEFKSKDGKDPSKISFEFFEDHTCKLKNGITGVEETGTWKQRNSSDFTYTFDKLFGDVDASMKEGLQKLDRDMEGGLVFSFFVFVVRLKKTAEGVVTEAKEVDIGDMESSPEDLLKKKEIVGRWKVFKVLSSVGGNFGMFTRAEVQADAEKKKAAGQISEARIQESLSQFDTVVDFADDNKIKFYSPIPADVSQQDIDEAVESGDIQLVDGKIYNSEEDKDWKVVKGELWYDTKEKREVCGERQSSWSKIKIDGDGRIEISMFLVEKM